MKIKNPVFQNIRILHKTNHKKYAHLCTQYLVGGPFARMAASMLRGMKVISMALLWKPR